MAWMNRQDNSGGQQRDYLNAPDTARRPMALASVLFTLLFIAAIALLLFGAGRWAYSRFTQQETSVTTTQQSDQAQEQPPKDDAATQDTSSGTTTDTTQTDGTSQDTTTTDTTNTESPEQANGTTTGAGSSGATNNQTTNDASSSALANTGPTTPEAVPNTGSASLVGIFTVSVVLAGFAHHRYLITRKR